MADNITITEGTGITMATDDAAGVHYSKCKLIDGTVDSTTPIAAGIGTKTNALRVVPADDISDATYIGDIKFGESLPAGTNAIGKLAANTGIDIGDVDVTSVPAPLNVVGGGTEATALRVTIANDSTGVLTVDGTITASNTAGDIAHDDGDSGNPVKVGGKAVNIDGTAPGTAVAENDRTNFITDTYGRQCVETVHPNFWSVPVNYVAAQTNQEIKAAPGAGLSLYITDVVISNGAVAGNAKFLEDTGTPGADKIEIMYFAVNGGAALHFRTPIKITANKNFGITSVACTTHSVTVNGYTAP